MSPPLRIPQLSRRSLQLSGTGHSATLGTQSCGHVIAFPCTEARCTGTMCFLLHSAFFFAVPGLRYAENSTVGAQRSGEVDPLVQQFKNVTPTSLAEKKARALEQAFGQGLDHFH